MSRDFDTQVGQLALARGMVDLATLLRCARDRDEEAGRLAQALVSSGVLTREEVDELEAYLRQADPDRVEQEFDAGDTIVMDSIYNPDRSAEVVATAQTLAGRPPATERDDRQEPSATGVDLSLMRESRYEFLSELGRGGMGQVLLARDRILGRDIALKTLLPDSEDAATRERLLLEAQVTGLLEHPSIVPIYDVGALSNDEPFYTMRVVREQSLEQIVATMADGEAAGYSLTQLVSILRQVSLAVHYAHDRGVIHRDLKPENILIGAYGEVFVIDWGIAKVIGEEFEVASNYNSRAYSEQGTLVGTPQYMAPEQAQGENEAIDERTDVYALGAILYEILTLTPVFSSNHMLSLLFKVIEEPPEAPSRRAPQRVIPRELEEICLRALAKQPAARYRSAQAFADDLELFLEGVKERERRREMAAEATNRAHEVRQAYQRARETHAQIVRDLKRERLSTPTWAPPEQKHRMWQLERRAEDLRVEIERHFGETTRLYGQALGHQPDAAEAREALAELYWERFTEAEATGNLAGAAYFEGLVRQYNDGQYDTLLEGRASLRIETTPPGVTVELCRFVEHERRLVPEPVADLGTTPVARVEVSHGSYLLRLRHEGRCFEVPVRLDRIEQRRLQLRLPDPDRIPDDFVFIPAGEFLSGELDPLDPARSVKVVDDFAIMRYPVTCAQYIEFLNDLVASRGVEAALAHAPRSEGGESYFPLDDDGRFILPEVDAEGDSWKPDWPICIVSFHDAQAYANWRAERDGRPYRLPTADEWEKTARGVDGRLYPWGDHFDAAFCKMRESRRGKAMPVPVGSYPTDRSPYGVVDMAGNICEWTTTWESEAEGTRILQGGSYNSIPLMCRLDWHISSPASFRHAHYGFRLAMDLDQNGASQN